MIQEINNTCINILNYFENEEWLFDDNKNSLRSKIILIQENQKEFDLWFKSQFNSEESIIHFIYTQLLEVRNINKKIQTESLSQKISEIKEASIASNSTNGSQSQISSFINQFKTYKKKFRSKGLILLNLLENSQEKIILSQNTQTPKRTYTLEKISYLINFEINCLDNYDIPQEQQDELETIKNKQELKWILDLIKIKSECKQILNQLLNQLQELLTIDFEECKNAIFLIENKSKQSSQYESLKNQSFQINSDIFQQLLNDRINKIEQQKTRQSQQIINNKQDKDLKVCMCHIF